MPRNILVALVILVVLVVLWAVLGKSPYTTTRTEGISAAFKAFRDAPLDSATRIVLSKGAGTVELKKEGDSWVVASSYGYPADGETVGKIVKGLSSLKTGEPAGRSAESHEALEVDKRKGGFVTAYGADGKLLGSVVVGKYAPSRGIGSTRVFVRFGDEPETWDAETSLSSDARLYGKDAEGKNYLQRDLVKLPEDVEIESVRVSRPEKPDLLVERKYREIPVEKPKEAETPPAEEKKDEKPETKKEPYFVVTSGSEVHEVAKDEEYVARGFVDRGKTVNVDDAVEPKALAEYGLDKPQLRASFTYAKKDKPDAEKKTVTLAFGNAKKDEKGTTTGYYFLIEGEEQKGRIYLAAQYGFDGWNKELKDFLPKPKEEPKKEGDPGVPSGTEVPSVVPPAAGGTPVPPPTTSDSAPVPVPAATPDPAAVPVPAPAPAPAPVPTPAPTPEPAPTTPPAAVPPAAVPPAAAPAGGGVPPPN